MHRFKAFAVVPLMSLALCLGACKQKEGKQAAPAASGSAAASECGTYAKALCDKSGAESPHCLSIRDLEAVLPPKACTAAAAELAFTEGKMATERKPCADLMERLCKEVGPDTESCKMVRARTPSFPVSQCVSMTENYASVIAELRKVEEKHKPLDAARQAAMIEGARAVSGPKDAKAQVVIFSDFQCPYCAKATGTVEAVRRNFGDKVHLVFRQFPLPFHEDAHLAAEASLAAAAQGKFWEFHDKVFANQGAIKRDNLEAYAKELKLDVAKFKDALDKGTFKAAVDEEIALGRTVNVEGTPTMFVNGKVVQNVGDAPGVVAMVDSQLK